MLQRMSHFRRDLHGFYILNATRVRRKRMLLSCSLRAMLHIACSKLARHSMIEVPVLHSSSPSHGISVMCMRAEVQPPCLSNGH